MEQFGGLEIKLGAFDWGGRSARDQWGHSIPFLCSKAVVFMLV